MHLPALGPWSLTLLLSLPVASCSSTTSQAIGAPTTSTTNASPRIDGDRMYELLAMLASDGLGGRYTLSAADIGRSAELLATQYREADISPVGTEYRHDFQIVTGIELRGAQSLRVLAGSGHREAALPPDAFTPLPVSGSGVQQGDLVFVGYAARSEDGAYDDLAGLDLAGKIALVLTDLPGQPSARRLAERVRELSPPR